MSKEQRKNSSFLMQGMILAVAGIITRLIGIAYRIPVNNILGDEGQGFYGCAFSIYNIALLLTSFSLPLAVSKLVSARVSKGEYKNAQRILKGALIFALVVGAITSIIVYIFSDFIAGSIMSLRLSTYALKVLAPGLLIVAIMGVIRGYFQGLGTMVPTAISQILEQIVNAVVSIIGASYLLKMGKLVEQSGPQNPSLPYAYGAAGGTLGTVSGALFGLIFLLVLLKIFYPKMKNHLLQDTNGNTESYKEVFAVLFLTIAPVILSTAINNINDTIDQGIFSNIMVAQGHSEKVAAEFLGMFTGKYNTLIYTPQAVANALGASLIPSLTVTVARGTKEELKAKINMVIRLVMLIAIPSCIAFMVLPKQILSLLYVGNISTPAKMLQLGAITVVLYCFSTVTNAILQGLNRMSAPVKHGAISLIIHLVAVVVMLTVFKWGIYSLVLGNAVFGLTMCILNTRAIKKEVDYKQEIKKTFVIPFVSAIFMGIISAVLWYLLALVTPDKLATLVTIFVAVLIYGISLLKFGCLSPKEIKGLPKGDKLLRIFGKLHLVKEEA